MQTSEQSNGRDYERDLWELEARQRSRRRLQLIFQLYVVFGALIGLLSIAYFFFLRLKVELNFEERTALLFAGVGFAISILSALFLFLRRQRNINELDRNRYIGSASEFLLEWLRFETIGREKLEATGKDFNRMSVREIISTLLGSGALTAGDAAAIEEALRFRNFLVHSGKTLDQEELSRMTQVLRNIVQRLEA